MPPNSGPGRGGEPAKLIDDNSAGIVDAGHASHGPIAHAAGVPFLAPFTWAEFLRDLALDYMLNLRASYGQEMEEMVARLSEGLGAIRVAVFYQDDVYGPD